MIPCHFCTEIPSYLHIFLLDVGGVFLISSIAISVSSSSVSEISLGALIVDFHLRYALLIDLKITKITNDFLFSVFVDVSNAIDNCTSAHLTLRYLWYD